MPDLSSKPSKDIKWPIYSTLEEFKAAGSKLKKLLQLVIYHLNNPSASQIQEWSEVSEDMVWLEIVRQGSRETSVPKILIYFYFAAMADTIISVCVAMSGIVPIDVFDRHSHYTASKWNALQGP
jgi:hypothetical protein